MHSKHLDLHTAVFAVLTLCLLFLLLSDARAAAEGIQRGLALCIDTLLPTLFPFLVLSELLISCRAGELAGKVLQRPAKLLFGISGAGAAALFTGMLCGFPVGTSTAVSLYDRGEITHGELKRIFLFANNPGPGFLIGAVGGGLFGSIRVGVALWCIVWGSAIALGILLRIWGGDVCENINIPANGVKKSPTLSAITGAVTKGLSTLLQVFSFVLFFSCVTACIAPLLQAIPLPQEVGTLLLGLPEMTAGIAHAATALPARSALPTTAFLAGFAGFSICLQLFAVSEGRGLHPLPYLGIKLVQGGICAFLTVLYLRLAPPVLPSSGTLPAFAENRIRQSLLFTVICVALLCLLLLTRHSQKNKWERP